MLGICDSDVYCVTRLFEYEGMEIYLHLTSKSNIESEEKRTENINKFLIYTMYIDETQSISFVIELFA